VAVAGREEEISERLHTISSSEQMDAASSAEDERDRVDDSRSNEDEVRLGERLSAEVVKGEVVVIIRSFRAGVTVRSVSEQKLRLVSANLLLKI
jgi:hypothetical protein